MPYYPPREPGPNGNGQEPKKPSAPCARYVRIALACLSAVLILYGGIRLAGYFRELNESRDTSRELQQIREQTEPPADAGTAEATPTVTPVRATEALPAVTPVQTAAEQPAGKEGILPPVPYPDNPGLKVPARFVQLRRKSGYIIGWLSLDGVEEAVGLKDNTFFLNHDVTGKRNSNGAIFLDEAVSLLTRPHTIYLYGHNMKSGNMFGKLKKYLDSSYCFKHRIITFDSLYEEGKYAVFAAAEFSTVPGTATWLDLWALNSNRLEEREEAIRSLTALSPYGNVLDVRGDEQILLLITCIDRDTDRLVVAARRLREGETEERLTFRKAP